MKKPLLSNHVKRLLKQRIDNYVTQLEIQIEFSPLSYLSPPLSYLTLSTGNGETLHYSSLTDWDTTRLKVGLSTGGRLELDQDLDGGRRLGLGGRLGLGVRTGTDSFLVWRSNSDSAFVFWSRCIECFSQNRDRGIPDPDRDTLETDRQTGHCVWMELGKIQSFQSLSEAA